ncbi:hypothetical protein ACHAWF_016936 [Thalassiosira exigua]
MAPDQGPSLPPKVKGEIIGTLTISLRGCSVVGAFARIRFWGESTCSDVRSASNDRKETIVTERPDAVKYPLIGSVLGLQKYLEDASPLRVDFLMPEVGQMQDETIQPSLVGHGFISDLCAGELLKVQASGDALPKAMRLLHQRRLQIFCPDSIPIGEALFDLIFHVFVSPAVASQAQTNPSRKEALIPETIIPPKPLVCPLTRPNLVHLPRPPHAHTHAHTLDNHAEDQQSLLEELLDLCADDMTMPTMDSANSCIDPYDMWLSRIVARASSPGAKEFLSLVAAGSHRSDNLRKVGSLKLEVNDVVLDSKALDRIKGKKDFHLQYKPPPLTLRSSGGENAASSNANEFLVCERFANKTKRSGASKSAASKSEHNHETGSKKKDVSLLASALSRQLQLEFKHDDSVRQWLDFTMEFSLLYSSSKSVENLKLPRVAMLAGKKKRPSSVENTDRLCIARACLRLRDVILSDTLTSTARLDFALACDDGPLAGLGEIGTRVGSLSVNLTLQQLADECTNHAISGCPTNYTGGSCSETSNDIPSSSTLKPHPISIFLSKYIGDFNNNSGTNGSIGSNAEGPQKIIESQEKRVPRDGQAVKVGEPDSCNKTISPRNQSLQPVKAPPVWLHISVGSISLLNFDRLSYGTNPWHMRLRVSCSEQILPMGNQPFHDFEIHSQKMVEVRTGAVCSWQIALERGHERGATITLQIHQCSDGGESTLIGIVNVPLDYFEDTESESLARACKWLPNIVVNGGFDVHNPATGTPIGNAHMVIAVGTLRQIRGFPEVLKSAVKVQACWRKSKREPKQSQPTGKTRLNTPKRKDSSQDCDPVFDTVHACFLDQQSRPNAAQANDQASPDSLFEEWSQQSLPLKTVQFSDARECEDTISTLAKSEVRGLERSSDSSTVSKSGEELTNVSNIKEDVQEVSKAADSLHCNENDATVSEQSEPDDNSMDEKLKSASSDAHRCSPFEIMIRLEKINGLCEILSTWCCNRRCSLTSAWGFFVSYSVRQENAAMPQQQELHRLCVDKYLWHSPVLSSDTVSHEVELDLESMISVPNYESDTEMILSQTLEFKVWFVPIITKSIAEMMNGLRAKDIRTLGGCTVISIAKCPLYHLYTFEGFYRGKVPFEMVDSEHMKDGACVGSITTSICPVQKSSNSSSTDLKDEFSMSKGCGNPVMSTLKPLNLDVSFSREQSDCGHRSAGVDPPEEITRSRFKGPCSKRKMEQSNIGHTGRESRDPKRHRMIDNPMTSISQKDSLPQDPSTATAESTQEMHQNDVGEESETVCPSESSFDWERYSDADDPVGCRSLSSVMESLEHINSKLQKVGSSDEPKGKANPERTCSVDDTAQNGVKSHVDTLLEHESVPPHYFTLEPPEENHAPETPLQPKRTVVDTCEKGNSPMSLAYRCADATTSPCGDTFAETVEAVECNKAGEVDQEFQQSNVACESPDEAYECEKNNANQTAKEDPSSLSREDISQRLDQRLAKRKEMRSLVSGPGNFPNHLIGNFSNRYSPLASASSCRRGSLRGSFLQPGDRNGSMLTSFLKSISPPRRDVLSGERSKIDWSGKGTCPNNSTDKPEKVFQQEPWYMSDDRDRLERIFRSKS